MRRVPFFIPVNGMGTLVEPACETYRLLEDIEERPVVSVSFAPGLPAAGLPECGPTIWAYSFDEDAAERAADALLAKIVGEESR
jgi:microcystin degradation protein MlrC